MIGIDKSTKAFLFLLSMLKSKSLVLLPVWASTDFSPPCDVSFLTNLDKNSGSVSFTYDHFHLKDDWIFYATDMSFYCQK